MQALMHGARTKRSPRNEPRFLPVVALAYWYIARRICRVCIPCGNNRRQGHSHVMLSRRSNVGGSGFYVPVPSHSCNAKENAPREHRCPNRCEALMAKKPKFIEAIQTVAPTDELAALAARYKGDRLFELFPPIFRFACEPEDNRSCLDYPWIHEGFAYASDGRIIVRKRSDERTSAIIDAVLPTDRRL